jgi:serine protease Do
LGSFREDQGVSFPALKKIGVDKVEALPEEIRQQHGYQNRGVVIKSIHPGSIAYRSSLRAGSIILTANNQKVSTPEELNEIVEKALKDKRLLLLVRQGNVIKFINLKL